MKEVRPLKSLNEYGLNGDFVVYDIDDLTDEMDDGTSYLDMISIWIEDNWEAICRRDCEYFRLSDLYLSMYHVENEDKAIGIIIDGMVSSGNASFITNQRDADDWDEHSFSFEDYLEDTFIPVGDIIDKKLSEIAELIIDEIQKEYARLYDIAECKEMDNYHYDRTHGYDD